MYWRGLYHLRGRLQWLLWKLQYLQRLRLWIDDNGMPAYTAPPSANAGNAGMHGGLGGGGEGTGNGVMGLGGLGVVTMLIM